MTPEMRPQLCIQVSLSSTSQWTLRGISTPHFVWLKLSYMSVDETSFKSALAAHHEKFR